MKKKINAKFIRTLNPCESGIENFEKSYPNFNGTLAELLTLENIPYSDKVWLAIKIVDLKVLQFWSLECAETVLHIFEERFPNDPRVRNCLEVTRKVLSGELASAYADYAAYVAAYACEKIQEDLNLALLITLLENN